MQTKTMIFVAHRLKTIAHCDVILVMNHGAIAERGTHVELLALKGLYFDLWHSQNDDT